MLDYKKNPGGSFLESHNKIINILLSSNGQVDSATRIEGPQGPVQRVRYRCQEVRRSVLLLRNFWLKNLPRHAWPSQPTHRLAEFFVKKFLKKLSKNFERHY